MKEYLTHEFVATEHTTTSELELWVDWIPNVDSNPTSPVVAHLDRQDLLIVPQGNTDPDKRTRRVVGLAAEIVARLGDGFTWRVCGPSGILGEHRLKPNT